MVLKPWLNKGKMATMVVYIGLGSNLGQRTKTIQEALRLLGQHPLVVVDAVSSYRETDPQGGPPQPRFINAVARIKTVLPPEELLSLLQSIEKKLGRVPTVPKGPRTIDLDILLYGDCVINEVHLTVPHPRMFERDFVMEPLLEIAPEMKERLMRLRNSISPLRQS